MTFGSLFAGVGGMDLGLERAGMTCRWQVEIDSFCQKVLTKHWPGVPKYGDITKIIGDELEPVDLIAGGFPCQDVSVAGQQAGITGKRSGLYAELLRLVDKLRPRFVLVENVSGLLIRGGIGRVLGDLAECGFDAEWKVLRASDFGLFHQRARVFIVAYPAGLGLEKELLSTGVSPTWDVWCKRQFCTIRNGSIVRPVPYGVVWGVADGLSVSVDRTRLIGNAVVPDVAEWIGRRIIEAAERSAA